MRGVDESGRSTAAQSTFRLIHPTATETDRTIVACVVLETGRVVPIGSQTEAEALLDLASMRQKSSRHSRKRVI